MSGKRIKAICLALILSGLPGGVLADMTRTFATCVGRFSAQMEHQWLMSDRDAERTQVRREAMLGLLEATATPAEGRRLLAVRIDAKQAHTRLLTLAVFGEGGAQADHAQRQADRNLSACTGLLLG